MSTLSRLVGLCVIALTFMAMVRVSPGTNFAMFVDFPSAIWILGIVCGGLLIAFPISTILRAVWSLFQPSCNRDDLLVDVSVFRRAHQLTWAAGIAGLLVSCIGFLGNMDDPDAIGPTLAVAMICPLYAAFLAEIILLPISQNLVNRATLTSLETRNVPQAASESSPIRERGLLIVSLLLTMFFGLMLANSEPQPQAFGRFGEVDFTTPGEVQHATQSRDLSRD